MLLPSDLCPGDADERAPAWQVGSLTMRDERERHGCQRYSASAKGARFALFSGLYVVAMAGLIAMTTLVTGRSFGEQVLELWVPLALWYIPVLLVALRGTSRDS